MTESPPFSRIVRVDALARGGQNMTIEASPSEREALRTREVARLDVLGDRIRKRTDLTEEEIDRRLQALLRLGKALHVA